MEGLDAETVSKRAAAPRVVHWAGVNKKACQRDMIGADLLAYFEEVYSNGFRSKKHGGFFRATEMRCRTGCVALS